jgi:hypothetical protein
MDALRAEVADIPDDLIAHVSRLAWEPVNVLAWYAFYPATARP